MPTRSAYGFNTLASETEYTSGLHFKSQSAFLEGQRIDYHGTLENMCDLASILEEKFQQPVRLEWSNRTSRRKPLLRRRGQHKLLPAELREQRSLPHATELLTKELSVLMRLRYADDLELWRTAMGKG